jgi:hypothetical protein
MAFPVTHVYFAERIKLDSHKAIKGTLVNDIGYLFPIKRVSTHPYFLKTVDTEELKSMNQDLSQIKSEDREFYEGYFFHMYLDRLLRDAVFVKSESQYISLIIRCIQEKYSICQYDDFRFVLSRLNSQLSVIFFIPRWKLKIHYTFMKFYFWAPWKMTLLYMLFFITGKVKIWDILEFFLELKRIEGIVVCQTQKVSFNDLMEFYGSV